MGADSAMVLYAEIRKQLKEFSLNLSFSAGGGCLGILGSSGCGKSLTLKAIAGIIRPDQGRIVLKREGETGSETVFFDSQSHICVSPQKRRVGYLFQDYALFPNMTIEENILSGLNGGRMRRAGDKEKRRIQEMIERFCLLGLEGRYPGQLSGGQQQRAALARIFAYQPEILLMDEPFSAMDSFLKEGLRLELLSILQEFEGVSILVTHDRDEVFQLCPNLLLMDQGRILTAGKTRDIFRNPRFVRAARLTGCKNISRIERLGLHRVRALDWKGIELVTEEAVEEEITFIGIRAHDFCALSDEQAEAWKEREDKNLIAVSCPVVSEMPFAWYITLDNGLWWKQEKTMYTHDAFLPRWLRVEPSAVLLLRGQE